MRPSFYSSTIKTNSEVSKRRDYAAIRISKFRQYRTKNSNTSINSGSIQCFVCVVKYKK